jgi:uncharacterized protein (DUF1330 family)
MLNQSRTGEISGPGYRHQTPTPEETPVYYVEPSPVALDAFLAAFPDDTPVFMLNLMRFREQAEYDEGFDAEPCSGVEAYMRYGAAVAPLIDGVGGEVVWQGRPVAMVVGPEDKDWHLMALVRYPGKAAFLAMVSSEDYQAIAPHRTAALIDSRLIAHRE